MRNHHVLPKEVFPLKAEEYGTPALELWEIDHRGSERPIMSPSTRCFVPGLIWRNTTGE